MCTFFHALPPPYPSCSPPLSLPRTFTCAGACVVALGSYAAGLFSNHDTITGLLEVFIGRQATHAFIRLVFRLYAARLSPLLTNARHRVPSRAITCHRVPSRAIARHFTPSGAIAHHRHLPSRTITCPSSHTIAFHRMPSHAIVCHRVPPRAIA